MIGEQRGEDNWGWIVRKLSSQDWCETERLRDITERQIIRVYFSVCGESLQDYLWQIAASKLNIADKWIEIW